MGHKKKLTYQRQVNVIEKPHNPMSEGMLNDEIEDRDSKLECRIMELIATHSGIGHNELKRKVKDEHLTTTKTFDKKMKALRKEKMIERKQGMGKKIHYYLFESAESKVLKYDKKFDREMSKTTKAIAKIEKTFPDYDDYTKSKAFEILQGIQSECSVLLRHYKEQDKNYIPYGDLFLIDIHEIIEKSNDEATNNLKNRAQFLDQEIKNLRKKINRIMTNLRKSNHRTKKKLIEQLIKYSKTRAKHLVELNSVWSDIRDRVAYLKQSPKMRQLFESAQNNKK